VASSRGTGTSATPARARRGDGDARREQILREAMECFAESGFKGTTTRALAARCGITEAALYRYFASKEALYDAIIDEKMSAPELVGAVVPAAERGDDAGVFGGLARGILQRVDADPTFLRILLYTALEGHALAEPFFAARLRPLREFVTSYVARRIEAGAFRSVDPALAAASFLGMIFDHLNQRIVFRREPAATRDLDEVADAFVSIFLGGVRRLDAGSTP
jgi:AcrR family transcriptional regulator